MTRDLGITNHSTDKAAQASVTARASQPPVAFLDGAKIRDRRLALGLSETVLGQALGVSAHVIDNLEHGGNHSHLSIQFITDLASLLGADVTDLLAVDYQHRQAPVTGDAVADDDPETVGRCLGNIGRTHVDELSRALDWTIGRTRLALMQLEDLLEPAGLRLGWVADTEVEIVPATGLDVECAQASRQSTIAYGLRAREAAVVYSLFDGPMTQYDRQNAIAVGRLRSVDLVMTDMLYGTREQRNAKKRDEAARLTDTARFNLFLPTDTDAGIPIT